MLGLVAGHCYALPADPRSRGSWGRNCWALSGGRCCRRRVRGARTVTETWKAASRTARLLRCRCFWMCAQQYGRRWAFLLLDGHGMARTLPSIDIGSSENSRLEPSVGLSLFVLSLAFCSASVIPVKQPSVLINAVLDEHACDAPHAATTSMLQWNGRMISPICSAQGGPGPTGEPPLLFTAAGCGDRLATRTRQLARSWPEGRTAVGAAAAGSNEAAPVSLGDVAVAWAALQLLPHSCERWQEVCRWQTGRCSLRSTVPANLELLHAIPCRSKNGVGASPAVVFGVRCRRLRWEPGALTTIDALRVERRLRLSSRTLSPKTSPQTRSAYPTHHTLPCSAW